MRAWTQPIGGRTWTFMEVTARVLRSEFKKYGHSAEMRRSRPLVGLCIPEEEWILYRNDLSRELRAAVIAHEIAHVRWPAMSHRLIDPFTEDLLEALRQAR